ncbi:hypothetical protein PM082_002925 [Marasmius tenuissimus]|nr:hypothetical protein PM082_002925 [Marasmius tenuissimus]
MAPIHSREQLEAMKRVDLQRICKDYGLRANLKTEALIDMILDTSTPMRKTEPPPPPVQPTRRSVSTRFSSRTTLPRTSSVIIHETDDDEDLGANTRGTELITEETTNTTEEEPPQETLPLQRTRKAKDTQRRLGVGRPIAAGGSGARAVTKSLSVSRSRRAKSSRNVIPVEETIVEEEPEAPKEVEQVPQELTQPDEPSNALSPEVPATTTPTAGAEIERRINETLKPIFKQFESLKAEIEQYKTVQTKISQLQNQATELNECREKVALLTLEVAELRTKASNVECLQAEVRELKETVLQLSNQETRSSSEGDLASGFRTPINTTSNAGPSRPPVPGNDPLPHPGTAPVMLGKRHRDSTVSNITDVVEEGQEDNFSAGELATKTIRPNRKRARTNEPVESRATSGPTEDSDERHQPGFVVYNDREAQGSGGASFVDPPPPTTPLPRTYRAYSPSGEAGPSRSPTSTSEPAAENHPFAFSFLPVPPTPHPGSFAMHSFPFPEPPQSPTPGGNDPLRSASRSGEPQDIFQSFGLPSIGRPRNLLTPAVRTSSTDARNFINPAALTDSEVRDQSAGGSGSDDLASTLEGTTGTTARRTMYGTELETDTRFGDFGVEGVATGFWTGGGARF